MYGKLTVHTQSQILENWSGYVTDPIHLPHSSMLHHHFPSLTVWK